jgi:hypothetical protein
VGASGRDLKKIKMSTTEGFQTADSTFTTPSDKSATSDLLSTHLLFSALDYTVFGIMLAISGTRWCNIQLKLISEHNKNFCSIHWCLLWFHIEKETE